MTLFKQIMLGSILFIVVILGIVGIKDYKTSSDFIKDQLSINAKHTATSLGLALTTSLDELDAGIAEAIINPIFDSGYYKQIKLVDTSGNVIYENNQEDIYGISDFFIRFVNYEPPVESFDIIKWNKLGTISVQISPIFAYNQLYTTLKDLVVTLFAISLGAFVLIYFGLRVILAPLEKVKQQAEAILEHQFIIQDKLPFTQEVKKMVMAMNSMVGKVKDIFDKETTTLDKYNELLYKDEKTGLYNRRYFINKYNEYLDDDNNSSGGFFLLSIKETYNLKKFLGYSDFVLFLKDLSTILKYSLENSKHSDDVFCLNENDFALICDKDYEYLKLMNNIKALFEKFALSSDDFLITSAFIHFENTPLNELLSKIDLLLMQNKTNFSTKLEDKQGGLVLGKQEYKEFINNAILKDEFCFVSQDVLDDIKNIFHSELYLRLKIKDELKPAGYFMPIINELNMSKELDLYVIKKALSLNYTNPIAINVSDAIIKKENQASLEEILKHKPNFKVYFELAMSKTLNIGELISFSKFIKQFDISLGLDHFAMNKDYLSILNELNVSYIKISANSLLDLLEDKNTSGAKNSLENILNSKGIDIIAIGIEDELTLQKIKDLNISLVEGRLISDIKKG